VHNFQFEEVFPFLAFVRTLTSGDGSIPPSPWVYRKPGCHGDDSQAIICNARRKDEARGTGDSRNRRALQFDIVAVDGLKT